ncbi:MAG: 6-carboxytetrahydropterin synthase [Acidobacteria bacterium]|nr:6-carboxytetrahydropterin synthase [Acidobacteriota bacterium]
MIRVTRRYRFSASHRLHAPQLGEEENRRLYGKCNNPYGHGHNYEVEVSAAGPLDPRCGRVLDPRLLDRLVRRAVLDELDHRNLNTEVAAFRAAVPTSENLAVEIGRRLKRGWRDAFPGNWPRLERISIAETGRNIFEVLTNEIE